MVAYIEAGERRPTERAVFLGLLYGSLNVVLLPFIVAFRSYALTRLARGVFSYAPGLARCRTRILQEQRSTQPRRLLSLESTSHRKEIKDVLLLEDSAFCSTVSIVVSMSKNLVRTLFALFPN